MLRYCFGSLRRTTTVEYANLSTSLKAGHFKDIRAFSSVDGHTFRQWPTAKDADGNLLSRVSGPTGKPLSELSLSAFWDNLTKEHGQRSALVVKHEPQDQHATGAIDRDTDQCLRWTFSEMDDHINKLVQGLQQIGVKKGSIVAVLMMNNSSYAALQWATAKVGAILVTLNPSYSRRELKAAMCQIAASTLVLVPGIRSNDYLATLKAILPSITSASTRGDHRTIEDPEVPSLRRIVLVDNLSGRPRGWEGSSSHSADGTTFSQALEILNGRALDYRDLLSAGDEGSLPQKETDVGVDPNEVINLQLTSGTTGRPKAVALTSRNLLNNVSLTQLPSEHC